MKLACPREECEEHKVLSNLVNPRNVVPLVSIFHVFYDEAIALGNSDFI